MSFLRPVPMVKVGVVGLKDDQEPVLSVLHDLNAIQIEPISKEALQFIAPERAGEAQRTVGDQLIRFRGLKTALPRTPVGRPRAFASLREILDLTKTIPIDEEVGRLKREEDVAVTSRKSLTDTIALLERFSFYRDRLEYLTAQNVLAFFGEAKTHQQKLIRVFGRGKYLVSD